MVCRMLGHRGAEAATTMSRFGQVTGDFVMSDVTCSGVETTLLNCSFSEGVHCTGDEAAGVICKGKIQDFLYKTEIFLITSSCQACAASSDQLLKHQPGQWSLFL